MVATLVAALCLTGLAAPSASAQQSPPADVALATGWNVYGELGDGTTTATTTPVDVHLPAGTQLTDIAAGDFHSLAVTSDGRVLAWGFNNHGQLGDGTTVDRSTPVEVHLPAGVRATAVAGGEVHSMALTSDGRVFAWGANFWGQLGNGTNTDTSTPVEVHLPAGTRATAISVGFDHSLALTSDGRVLAWGLNDRGQVGDGTTTNTNTPVEVHLPAGVQVTAIAGGGYHSLALTSDGRIFGWGLNTEGELGDGTFTTRLTPVETLLPAGVQITAIAGGGQHSLALTSDGRVLAWGLNINGALGDGTTVNSSTPVEVLLPAGTRVTAVTGGSYHSLAVTSDGRILGWGYNIFGQLGDGTAVNRLTPVEMLLPPDVRATAVAAGYGHSLALAVRAETTTTLTATPTTAAPGEPVTLTAHVTCTTGTPTGTVEFFDDDTLIGTATLDAQGNARVTTTDLGLGTHRITARYQGNADCPASVSEVAVVTVEQAPSTSLRLDKRVESSGPFHVGDTVAYVYRVTNTGDVPLINVAVTDDLVSGIICDETTLQPGVSTLCHGSQRLTRTGQVTNTALATANTAAGAKVTSNEATATITVEAAPAAELTLTKRVVSKGPFRVGHKVEYAYTVTNTGSITLNDVTVTDDLVARVTCEATSLAPGESTTCTGTHTITRSDVTPCKKAEERGGDHGKAEHQVMRCAVTNTAHATAIEPNGNRVTSNTATATVTVKVEKAKEKKEHCRKQHGGHKKTYGGRDCDGHHRRTAQQA
ncbi:Ig-like domain repeat protein [Streptomyces sp. RY43-2]|uniref:Ig-like domain repeat protein n=1 Tax=Streptomyces macrolidinus TaxID=2952607 RepID=A0ABT0Z9E3_9ACTN|nr:Ig-like domain repeat protein [Streptomyces macrolidinus]MCN9240191.1 Ig-like domain repeat protein [Streptomyces macrolidinus]